VNEKESVKLLLHKRQGTKIEKYKNENKECDIDLSFKQLFQNRSSLSFLSLLDKFEINKKSDLIEYTFHLSIFYKVKINKHFMEKNYRIENIIVGIEPVKLLLKRKEIEEIEEGYIKNKDGYIIISYH